MLCYCLGKKSQRFPFCLLVGKCHSVNCRYTCFHKLAESLPFLLNILMEASFLQQPRVLWVANIGFYIISWAIETPEGKNLEGWGSFATSSMWMQHPEIAFCFPIEYITYFKLYMFITQSLGWPYLQMVWINFSAFSQNLPGLELENQPLFNMKVFLLSRM